MLVLLAGSVLGFMLYERNKESKKNNEIISQSELFDAAGNEIAIIYDFSLQNVKGICSDGRAYLPLSWVRDYINDKFYWDESISSIIYTLPDDIEIFRMADEEGRGNPHFINKNNELYLSTEFILSRSSITCSVFVEDEAKRVYISDSRDAYGVAMVSKETMLRTGDSLLQRGIISLNEGDRVRIISDEFEEWDRVLTESGFPGYVEKDCLEDVHYEEPVIEYSAPVYSHNLMDEEIVMVWNQLDNIISNTSMPGLIEKTEGVNVISPTWFSVIDNDGNINSRASHDYISYAHEHGIKVWALVDNFSTEISSTKLLSQYQSRCNLIENLITKVKEYDADGINVDFERLEEKCGIHFVEFIRELSVSCRREGLVLSVDNPNMQSFNVFYGRDAQAECADYVINMGYDEHYAGGDAGSVASLPFVEEGITNCLTQVPANQLINGIPFYTRLWTVTDEGVTSQAIGLDVAKKWVNDHEKEITLTWDDNLGQNYGHSETEHIWLEDEASLKSKISLGRSSGLAGIAGWKLGLDNSSVWELLR